MTTSDRTDPTAAPSAAPYQPVRIAHSQHVPVRGLRYHVLSWGDASLVSPQRPPLVLAHGWMDVGASFQFVVDELRTPRHVIALDWRGFGQTDTPAADSYWFADYLGDLDVLLNTLLPGQPVDLLGHSMGGNVVMMYAGVRPTRIRRLINLEGFGLPDSRASQAPTRYAQWLDELRAPQALKTYASQAEVAQRLRKTNPRLREDRAAWLAGQWARPQSDGRWAILGDPAHKRVNPVLYRKEEVLACWQRIAAPVLWVEGEQTDITKWWGDRYPRADFEARLAVVPQLQREVITQAGHMLHHDQPEVLAGVIERFLEAPAPAA